MKIFNTLVVLSSFLVGTLSFAGNSGVGGGDPFELKFKEIAQNIKEWIASGNADGLILPYDVTSAEYKQRMLSALSAYNVSFTSSPIYVGGVEKLCANSKDDKLKMQVECNSQRFSEAYAKNIDDIYLLVHHEFAGFTGIEKNIGPTSDYNVSKQISAYLRFELVKRLPVTPQPVPWSFEDRSVTILPAGSLITIKNIDVQIDPGQKHILVASSKELPLDCYLSITPSSELRSFKGDLKFILAREPVPVTFTSSSDIPNSTYQEGFDLYGQMKPKGFSQFWCGSLESDLLDHMSIRDFRRVLEMNNGSLVLPKPKPISK